MIRARFAKRPWAAGSYALIAAVALLTSVCPASSPAVSTSTAPLFAADRAGAPRPDGFRPASIAPRPEGVLVDSCIALAGRLFAAKRPDSALAVLNSLLETGPGRNEPAARLRVRLEQADILGRTGHPVSGESSAAEALAIAGGLRDSLSMRKALRWLSVDAGALGKWPESRSHASRLLDLANRAGDREYEGHAWLSLAYADLNEGLLREAGAKYDRAISLFRETGQERSALIALTGLGRVLDGLGEVDQARDCYRRIAEESRRIKDPVSEAHALNNLGAVEFEAGDPAKAVEDYASAYRLQRENGNLQAAIVPAVNLAVAQTYAGLLDEAGSTLEEALRICEAEGYRPELVIVLDHLAYVEKERNRLPEAAALFRRCARLAGSLGAADIRASSLTGLAECVGRMDSLDAGVEIIEREIDPLRGSIGRQTAALADRLCGELLLARQEPRAALRRFFRAERIAEPLGIGYRAGPLAQAGRCLLQLGEADSARSLLMRATRIWEEERSRSAQPEWRERLGVDARLLYGALAEVLLATPSGGREEERARAAFDALQRFKARTLRERMLGPGGSIGDSQRPRIEDTVTAEELQTKVLHGEEIFLDAFIGAGAAYLFCVSGDSCRVFRVPADRDSLERRLRAYRSLLEESASISHSADQIRFVRESGRRLARDVLGPAFGMIRSHDRIIFSPDDALNLIPLTEMIDDGERERAAAGSGRRESLSRRIQVVRVPSATILAQVRGRATREPKGESCRIFAMAGQGKPGDPELRGALEEARWLRRSFRNVAAGKSGEPFASSPHAPDIAASTILHFAGHTLLDDAAPWRSGIPVASAPGEDATVLRADSIAGMRLSADLVVLSGCETAGGKVVSGEGVLGLTAAFMAAGVPTVIATLWPVDDEVSARLIRSFYRSLARGSTAADALWQAQWEIRRDPRTAHPFYWAGFVLSGDGEIREAIRPSLLADRAPLWIALLSLPAGAFVVKARIRRRKRERDRSPGGRGERFPVISDPGGALKR